MSNHSNYRQYYKDYFGIEFSDNFVVHHVNFDRSCNDINNLLLLPKDLHTRYHALINEAKRYDKYIHEVRADMEGCQLIAILMGNLASVLEEINIWMYHKSTYYNHVG